MARNLEDYAYICGKFLNLPIMTTFRLYSIGLVVSLIAMCTACSGCSEKQQNAAPELNTSMFTKIGINLDSVNVFADKLTVDSMPLDPYSLDDSQSKALLNDVYRFDRYPADEIEGVNFIVGVKPYGNGCTLVVFLHEFGDGAQESMALYDAEGHMTDYADVGVWEQVRPQEMNEDYTAGTGFHERVHCVAGPDSTFTLERTMKFGNLALMPDDDGEPSRVECTDSKWEIQKRYTYAVDAAKGHFIFKGVDEKTVGEVPQDDLTLDRIEDLSWLPCSDPARLDRFDELATKLNPDRESMNFDALRSIMWRYYNAKPQQVLAWLYDHRTKYTTVASKVEMYLEDLFYTGQMRKEILVEDIRLDADTARRQWLDQLTSQWGPGDAVG